MTREDQSVKEGRGRVEDQIVKEGRVEDQSVKEGRGRGEDQSVKEGRGREDEIQRDYRNTEKLISMKLLHQAWASLGSIP